MTYDQTVEKIHYFYNWWHYSQNEEIQSKKSKAIYKFVLIYVNLFILDYDLQGTNWNRQLVVATEVHYAICWEIYYLF